MSIARKTVVGAIWHVITSVLARVIGVVGTWALTWMLEPSVVGEVGVAVIMVTTARLFTSFGMGQFVVANPKAERNIVFHATVINLCSLVLASVVVLLLGRPLAPLFHAETAVRYLPGITASVVIIGVAEIPERILMRDMRFRLYGGSVAFGEVVYAATSVALAAMGFGGMAIVIANVTRSCARFIVSLIAVPRADWLTPATIERQHLKRILGFGTPLLAANVSGHISTRWDNLIVSAMFGPGAMGAYNQAYNLANIPSETLGETAADVLLPSFAQVPVKQRRYAFLEAIALLGLIIFPLALGLGVVARPLVATLFSAKWQGVAPLLALLSFMSVFFPISNACQVFFKSEGRTPLVMKLQITQAVLMLSCVWSLGHLGLTWAAAAAGLSSGATTLAALFAIGKVTDMPLRSSLGALARPLVATAAMAVAALGVEHALVSIGARPAVQLALGILTGIVVYVPAAFLVAPEASRKLVGRLSSGLRRG